MLYGVTDESAVPMGNSSNIKVVSVWTDPNNFMDMTTGKHMPQSFHGRPSDFSFYFRKFLALNLATQAFPQAELSDPVFMRMPQGWYLDSSGILEQHQDPKYHDKDHYIQLKRSLYGCKQATRNWFQHLKKGILAQGFHQSKIDQCLYLRSDCIMVIYTDDCLIFAKNDAVIDDLINNLSTTFHLEDQGRVNDFLGINLAMDPHTKSITLTQTGLIDSILTDLNLSDSSNMKTTPADSILHHDPTGIPRQDSWKYRSIIGKLNFLAQNSRPVISFAVHQCACFCTCPTHLQKKGC